MSCGIITSVGRPARTVWPEIARSFGASPAIHKDDLLWKFVLERPYLPDAETAARRYFENGAESAAKLRRIIDKHLAAARDGQGYSLLEFASGYGMVTRHLPHALGEQAKITCCDIHPAAVEFIRGEFKQEAVLSHRVPEEVRFGKSFDVVFALSFFSHVPEATFGGWLRVLFDALTPAGIFVFTTHGLATRQHIGDITIPENGFFFRPASEQQDLDPADYGTTLTTPDYVTSQIRSLPGAQQVEFREAFWWGHQDLYVVARRSSALERIKRAVAH